LAGGKLGFFVSVAQEDSKELGRKSLDIFIGRTSVVQLH
jgi:hypothetical protein